MPLTEARTQQLARPAPVSSAAEAWASRWGAVVLLGLTAALYAPSGRFTFVHFDDPVYFYGPPQIRQGINASTLRWALTNTEGDYWHPVSSLVHLIACTMFPLDAGVQHLVTVALFAATVVALFRVVRTATGSAVTALGGAALWAWHPLRVESVAWLTERGAVLGALFCVLCLGAYIRYARRPTVRGYLVVAASFACAMLSKPTLPALPLALLTIDVWPLGRLQAAWVRPDRWRGVRRLLWEKVPLLLIAATVALLTLKLSAATPTNLRPDLGVSERALALIAGYGWFVVKTLVPTGLAAHHPWSNAWSPGAALAAALIIAGITGGVLRWRSAALVAGWFWFLLVLLPMLFGAGMRSSWVAGRYALLPHLLLFAALAHSIPRTRAAAWAATLVLAALAITSAAQLQHWRNSQALFAHTLSVTRDNHIIHYNLGVALTEQGRTREAAEHYARAVAIEPKYLAAHVNLGAMLEALGDAAGAESHYRTALALDPDDADAKLNLQELLARHGRATQPASR